MTNFIASATVAATSPQLFPSKRPAKSPAPWVCDSFVQVPREFFAVMHELSKTAMDVYLGHIANALSRGENAGRSYQYRDSFAAKYHCSKSKLDRGNNELERRGMIRQNPTRRANNAQEWLLLPPSAWLFDSLKTAPRSAPNRASEDAKPRPITREAKKESFKTNTASPVVALENSFPVPDLETATTDAERALIEIGVSKSVAAQLAEQFAAPEIFQQIAWLDARKPKCRPAVLIKAIRGGWDAPGTSHDTTGPVAWQAPQSVPNAAAREIWRADSSDKMVDILPDISRLNERDILPDKTPTPLPDSAPISPSEETLAGFVLADPETRDSICDAVFESLPETERDQIRARIKATLPEFLQNSMNSQGARNSMARGVRREVELLHEGEVRRRALIY